MSIMKSFGKESNQTMTMYALTTTKNASGVTESSYIVGNSITGFHYQASSSFRNINDKYKGQLDSYFLINYNKLTFTINKNDKAKINSIDYVVLDVENIANQNDVVQVYLRLDN